ncbi:MAG: transaldolase [Dehalococcoidia bacterium]
MGDRVHQLMESGQSIWLDFLGRDLIHSGELQRLIDARHLTGITSNPSIFNKAITGSDLYTSDIVKLAERGVSDRYEAFVSLAATDIIAACDAMLAVYRDTEGADGFVSFELPPGLEHDVEASVAEAHRLHDLIDRPNLMIKVPGTEEGVEILRRLIADGVNTNQTLLFSVGVYERTAAAYIAGLEERLSRGEDLSRVASVASFFVSRVDTAVDSQIPTDSPLRGQAAVANARHAYHRFTEIFSGAAWQRLADAGARVQRPLWASTSTKNPAYRDVLYVESLIAPHTVNTLPESTLQAVLDHCEVATMTSEDIAGAEKTLESLRTAGIDIDAVTDSLLVDGLAAFENDFQSLLTAIEANLKEALAPA